jgi:hypothetical protein
VECIKNSHLDESISERHAIAEIVGPGEVTVEGLRVELGEDVHLVDPAVYAVAHRHVDQPVRAANRHLGCKHRIYLQFVDSLQLHGTKIKVHIVGLELG